MGKRVHPLPTTKQVDSILNAIRAGNDPAIAAAAFGISRRSLGDHITTGARLLKRLKDPDTAQLTDSERALVNLAGGFEAALSSAEVGMVASIAKAARNGDWRAAAFWLERRARARYGANVEVNGTFLSADVKGEEARKLVQTRMKRLIELAAAEAKGPQQP